MALTQNFNVNPYYDDYEEDKKFLRMIFRPGYAVQARELTQLQTILQKQISRFGRHIFKNGSVVTGGEISLSTTVLHHKLQTTTITGDSIDVNNFLNKPIGNAHALASNGSLGKVIAVTEATDNDPPTIFVEYKTALSLVDNETLFTIDSDQFEARLISSNSTGRSSTVSINEGVFFVEDFFVKVSPQTIILEKYTNISSYRIGLSYNEFIIDEKTDTSLLDPALNSSNYQAPGSTRYLVELNLVKRTLDSIDDTAFIELIRVENGDLTLRNNYPTYAELEKTLARRTYDESGNYTVKPFSIYLKDHVPETGNAANNLLFTAKLSSGKAYVRGFEIQTISTTNLNLKKARDTESVNNYDVATNYGNYVTVANTSGLFDLSIMQTIDMHCVKANSINTSNSTTYSSTKIGTVRVRELEFISAANTQLANTYKYDMYLFDTKFNTISGNSSSTGTSNTIILAVNETTSTISQSYKNAIIRISSGYGADNVKHIISNYDATTRTAIINGTFSTIPLANSIYTIDFNIKDIESFARPNATSQLILASANVDSTNKTTNNDNGDVFFSDTNFKNLVFRIPQSFISFGMTDQDYRGTLVFKNQTVASGTLVLSTGVANTVFVGSGSLSDSQKIQNFYVVANSASGTEFTNTELVPFTSGTGRTISVSSGSATLNFNSSNTFTVDVIASVDFNTTTAKTKTLVVANTTNVAVSGGTSLGNTTVYLSHGQIEISTPNKIAGSSDSLYISDVFKLEGRFEEEYGTFDVIGNSQYGSGRKCSFKVIDSKNPSTSVVTADLLDSSKDITSKYTLNDGQKESYYDHAFITLKSGVSPPSGRILVLVNRFVHSGSGYFSVDSYNNGSFGANEDIRYSKIPNFISPSTGESFKLRDCIDLRPIRTNASNTYPDFTLSGIALTRAGESLESDYSYYIPRTDRLVLGEDKKFRVIEGISSINPRTPFEPDNSMSLYTMRVNPYTFFPDDVEVRYIENKRYTMQDIGKIEKRVENLEYYTALNTLEKSAQDLTILDSTGLERFKNGILVDSFRGHQIGDVKNIDYRCSMNFQEGELRPSFYANSVPFSINTSSTTTTVSAGTIVTSPFTIKNVIVQSVATTGIAVNPFVLSNYSGTFSIFPPSDFWIDTDTRPDVLINLEGENDAWEEIGKALEDTRAPGWGNQYGDWDTYVSGTDRNVSSTQENRTVGFLDYRDQVQTTTNTTYYSRERYGTKRVLVPERIVESIGKRQVDLSVVPYVRAQWLVGIGKGLRPNQHHYLFTNQGDTDGTKYIEVPTIVWLYNLSGDFNDSYGVYETVTSTSGGTAKILKQSGRSWSLEQTVLWLGDIRGTWAANDSIVGQISGSTASIDIMFWNNGNVISATANTLTLGSGAPYNNVYIDIVDAYANVTWPFTGEKLLEDPKEITEFYNVRIVAGTGLGQSRTITSYNGTTKVATLNSNWNVIPDNTSRWTVGKPQSDDFGDIVGRWYLPNYGPTAYDDGFRTRTGSLLIRMCNDANNNPQLINSFAEEFWYAQGVLNVVEDVSISVRVPTIQNQTIYELQDNFRTSSVATREVQGTTLVADRTPPPAAAGSGCKIICGEMAQMGFFEPEVNEADQRFGRKLKRKYPKIYRGYAYWANTVVAWLRGKGPSLYLWKMNDNNDLQKNITLHMTEVIARPWSEEMAYIEGVREKGSIVGKFVLWIGFFASVIVGLFNPDTNKKDTRLKGFTILGVMCIMYVIIKTINIITSPFNIIKEAIKNKLIRN